MWNMPRISRFLFIPPVFTIAALLAGCVGSIGHANFYQSTSVKDGYVVDRNLIYTPPDWPERIPADLYRPRPSEQLAPAVLLIHGGGWTGKDGRWQMEPIARHLAKRGYVVLNVTYRLAPKWIYPSPVEDMREAVKWLRAHAGEQGIDPERIAVFGYSAGGYLAEMVAYSKTPEDSKIRAVVAGGAPSNLAFYPGGDLVPQFLGGTQQQVPERFHEASPVNYVSRSSPPTFIYQGMGDQLVKPEHALASVAALKKAGVPHETYWIEGRDHIATFLFPASAVSRAIDFLDRHMKGK